MDDPNRFNPNVHYRIYAKNGNNIPIVVCVQDFDYPDYTNGYFLSNQAWDNEEDAQRTLKYFLNIDKMTNHQYAMMEKIDTKLQSLSEMYSELIGIDPNILTEISSHIVLLFEE